jgi:hypothetical protein
VTLPHAMWLQDTPLHVLGFTAAGGVAPAAGGAAGALACERIDPKVVSAQLPISALCRMANARPSRMNNEPKIAPAVRLPTDMTT